MDSELSNSLSTFTIGLVPNTAWLLRSKITPGPRIQVAPENAALAETVYDLRNKVNDALVSFTSDPERKSFPITITEEQAWIIDQVVPYDGDGIGAKLLMQIIRGLWGIKHGISDFPVRTSKDPWQWFSKDAHGPLLIDAPDYEIPSE